jgi:hypothetical protein
MKHDNPKRCCYKIDPLLSISWDNEYTTTEKRIDN